ncbi:hypothetical protein ACFY2K_11700 [Kitasatospora sp. NPDC001309]|uniref:hypothetical protein n=1 Tax=Kitasatospora sp. NPDC001309 TaxID=3364013 RepID=UPI00369AE44D
MDQTEIRDLAREAAVAKLDSIYSGQVPASVAVEIADAVLEVVLRNCLTGQDEST